MPIAEIKGTRMTLHIEPVGDCENNWFEFFIDQPRNEL